MVEGEDFLTGRRRGHSLVCTFLLQVYEELDAVLKQYVEVVKSISEDMKAAKSNFIISVNN